MAIDLNKGNYIPKEKNQHVLNSESAENGMVEKQRLFANPFSFSGRIRRLEFGLSNIINLILNILMMYAIVNMSSLWGLLQIPLTWFSLAFWCKRFHDRGKSGMYFLTLLIPLYNYYVFFMQFFADGDPYENDYGPDPKGRNIYA